MNDKPMHPATLLPPDVADRTSRWFGRAHNYPIYSLPWFRYRSVSMLIGTLLIIGATLALIGLSRASTGDGTVDLWQAAEASLVYFAAAAATILVGPAMALGVRRRQLSPRLEVAAIAAVLVLGIVSGTVLVPAYQNYGLANYDSARDVTLSQRLWTIADIDIRPAQQVTRIGLRDPAVAGKYVAAYQEVARQFGLPDRVIDGWPAFMDADERRLVNAMRALAPDAVGRDDLQVRYSALLGKVYRRTDEMLWRTHWQRMGQPTPAQEAARRALTDAMFVAPVKGDGITTDTARRTFETSAVVMLLAHLALVAWLGGLFDLPAFVRQRGMLGDAHARRELERTRAARNDAEMRLSMLAAQVEPHFLFNTLASVRSAIATDPERAGHIIDHMVDYLRATIPQMRGEAAGGAVALENQLAAAHAYLALMHERMPRLHFAVDADPALSGALVPPLMLISLVENAVKHGIEPKIGAARIDVQARRVTKADGDMLELSVIDDGVGFGASASGSGIGLANIQERLRALYGKGASLTLKPGTEGGVAATLRLPLSFASEFESESEA